MASIAHNGDRTVAQHEALWTKAVLMVSHAAHDRLPEALHGRLEAATALAQDRTKVLEDGALWHVKATKDGWYTVNGGCGCKDVTTKQAPEGCCKHWLAVELVKQARALPVEDLTQGPHEVFGMQDAEASDDGWAPEELGDAETRGREDAATDCSVAASPPCPVLLGIERSPQIGALMGALARAQARMSNPTFDSTNPHFKNKYASLAEVRNAVMPALTAEGIAVTQLPTTTEPGWVSVTTGLWHGSGQYLCSTLRLPVQKSGTPQDYGSALTYARRYALQGICNVAGDEDDDGNAASGRGK